MARITARQAFTRAQSRKLDIKEKKREQKRETTRALIEARNRYVQQLKGIGILKTQFVLMPTSPSMGTNSDPSYNHNNNNNNYSPTGATPYSPSESKVSTRSATKGKNNKFRKAAQGNKKITDYYAVSAKGRENVHLTNHLNKSSPSTPKVRTSRANSQQKAGRSSSSPKLPEDIEIITISDDDDDNNDQTKNANRVVKITYLDNPSIKCDIEDSVKLESHAININSPFKDLNIRVEVDEDVEIVEMLPPIALREHPIVDLDG